MLLQIGPLQFDVQPFNAHEIVHDAATDYAKKDVVGRRRIYEHVGEGDEVLTIKGRLFPFKIGGLGAMQLLQRLQASGTAQYVVRGDGYAMGWFVITKVNAVSTHLSRDGVGQKIDVVITIERADSPSAAGAFFNLFGLAP